MTVGIAYKSGHTFLKAKITVLMLKCEVHYLVVAVQFM